MKLLDIITFLESKAPLTLQEAYDNAGLLVGQPQKEVNKALITLDVTAEVMNEARRTNCDLIVSHHPVIFRGLKRLTGANMVEQIVIDAVKNDIALYAIHTNLDNVFAGVNEKLAQKIGLTNNRILVPREHSLKKLVCFCPLQQADTVRKALFDAGAGSIGNYSHCSFNATGEGSFKAGEKTHPFVGKQGELHFEPEVRIETIVPSEKVSQVVRAMVAAHPYEEVAYDVYPLDNRYEKTGAGMMGETEEPVDVGTFLLKLKNILGSGTLRHSPLIKRKVKKVAICGGSGSFLIDKAYRAKADIFVTADVKYHDFFLYNGQMTIVDAGHFETEQFTRELLFEVLKKKFPTFALQISNVNTNAVSYF